MSSTQWVRIDTGYLSNPKIRRVGRDGALCHMAAILYLGEHRIDSGLLPAEAIEIITVTAFVRRPEPVIERLVKHGLWHPVFDDGYLVHDYADMNGASSKAFADRVRKQRWRDAQT